jgi:malate dehydrogenase (oxaloacetate-decarboxylating)(NADP+)
MAAEGWYLVPANPRLGNSPERVRHTLITAAGRSDYQTKLTELCFRLNGVRSIIATLINESVGNRFRFELAQTTKSDIVAMALSRTHRWAGGLSDSKPFRPRAEIAKVAPAVAHNRDIEAKITASPITSTGGLHAAHWTSLGGTATRAESLKHVFAKAKQSPKRIVYAEGERVLHAPVQIVKGR